MGEPGTVPVRRTVLQGLPCRTLLALPWRPGGAANRQAANASCPIGRRAGLEGGPAAARWAGAWTPPMPGLTTGPRLTPGHPLRRNHIPPSPQQMPYRGGGGACSGAEPGAVRFVGTGAGA